MPTQSPNNLSREALETISRLPVPIFFIQAEENAEPCFSYLNKAAEEGIKKRHEEIIGKTAEQIFDGASGIAFGQKLNEITKDQSPISFIFTLHNANYRSQFQVSMVAVPKKSEHCRKISILATAVDVTEGQSALSESMQMALLVSEMESFMAQSADELQAPIEHLSVLSKELKANFKDLGDGKLQLLDQVEALSKDTLNMVSRVITRSRAINPNVDVWQRYDFKQLCQSVFELFDPLGHHNLIVDHAWVSGDIRTMRIVLATIFENALRHNLPKELSVSVNINQNSAGDMLHVTTLDNGQGFRDPITVFLKQPKKQTGPGLSLINLREWVKDGGGFITVSAPAEEAGAVISFSLPGKIIS